MPNWCINKLDVTGPEDLLDAFREATTLEDDNALSFACLVPPPVGLLDGANDMDWRGWVETHWGTKWDISEDSCAYARHNEDALPTDVWEFSTAWAPPSAWAQKVSEMFPDLTFRLWFDEPGMNFSGCEVYVGGNMTEESWDSQTCSVLIDCAVPGCEEYLDGVDAFARHDMPNHEAPEGYCPEHELFGMVAEVAKSEASVGS